jgi:vacuolar-type H+-ATPase subunit E/Vma4
LEALLKEIEENCNLEIRKIEEEARLKIEEIKRDVQNEISKYKEEIEKKVEEKLSIEREKILGEKKRDLKNKENYFKCLLISKVKDTLLEKIRRLRKEDPNEYQKIFNNLLEEIIPFIKRSRILLRVSPEDKKLASRYLQSKNISFQIIEDKSISTGLILIHKEEEMVIHNTFNSRWKRLYPWIKEKVARIWEEEIEDI